jgi:hypothetical protein
LSGFYEPICVAGVNGYEVPEFNVIRAEGGYVMGAIGEACPESTNIVRSEDCKYAIEQLSDNPAFGSSVASVQKMGGCSLQADESRGWYNDKHPQEKNIRDNDPPSWCKPYTAEQCAIAAERLGLQLGGNGHDFESPNHSQKGCYAYSSGSHAGMAFYGSGASNAWETIMRNTNSASTYRPSGYDCTGFRDEPREGSYAICYAEKTKRPKEKQHIKWTAEYWWVPPPCPAGYYHTGDFKRCGWGHCLECFQPYDSCENYPNHFLVKGRVVGNTKTSTCLDSSKIGNARL